MRIALSAFLMLLFVLAAWAGEGCRRPAVGSAVPVLERVAAAPSAVLAEREAGRQEDPVFVFCHPRADQLKDAMLSAAAAQVAYDTQATNDDRTEMIAFAADPPIALLPLQAPAPALRPALPLPWLREMLRPPRARLA